MQIKRIDVYNNEFLNTEVKDLEERYEESIKALITDIIATEEFVKQNIIPVTKEYKELLVSRIKIIEKAYEKPWEEIKGIYERYTI